MNMLKQIKYRFVKWVGTTESRSLRWLVMERTYRELYHSLVDKEFITPIEDIGSFSHMALLEISPEFQELYRYADYNYLQNYQYRDLLMSLTDSQWRYVIEKNTYKVKNHEFEEME